jgi:hypothetical protein
METISGQRDEHLVAGKSMKESNSKRASRHGRYIRFGGRLGQYVIPSTSWVFVSDELVTEVFGRR